MKIALVVGIIVVTTLVFSIGKFIVFVAKTEWNQNIKPLLAKWFNKK